MDRLRERQEAVRQKNEESIMRMQQQEARNNEKKRQDKMKKDQLEAKRNERKQKDWEERENARVNRCEMKSDLHNHRVQTHKRNFTDKINNKDAQWRGKMN